jgi:hypothetical protein
MNSNVLLRPLESFSSYPVPGQQDQLPGDNQFFPAFRSAGYRSLLASELEILKHNGNTAEDWARVLVASEFDAALVQNCEFWGDIRIGKLSRSFLEHHQLRLPVGLYNCLIVSSVIGDNCCLRNVRYLANYKIDEMCILFNVDEMLTKPQARFGHGLLYPGEDEKSRLWMELSNENGGRSVLAFNGMLAADAYLWSKYRDHTELMQRFKELTDRMKDQEFHAYGTVGEQTVIKNSRSICDANIGASCFIDGANKLENLTVNSSAAEPTHIGEGVELENGVVGYGNRIYLGVKAIQFVTGRNVQLKYGARMFHTYLGDNSTISCCEALSNLIFPFHEQHHNNSFLIATTIMGQCNIAAGATIGSNHNSRAADGEIIAGRGFWPGLMSNFKHNSIFASFCLVAKGSYSSEMNIPLPFALVSPGDDHDSIRIAPGFWFRYNMYAIARNAWKFKDRDMRLIKDQNIEFDYLAPDTVEEMFRGMAILQKAVETTIKGKTAHLDYQSASELDRKISVTLDGVVNKGRAFILKPLQGIQLYRNMIAYYGARELLETLKLAGDNGCRGAEIIDWAKKNYRHPQRLWHNIGGQIIADDELHRILTDVQERKINDWRELHQAYNRCWEAYPTHRRNHGMMSVLTLRSKNIEELDRETITEILIESQTISRDICNWAEDSRKKDYTNPFRKAAYRNDQEMEAVLGKPQDNSFLKKLRQNADQYVSECEAVIRKLDE